jgi:hypothetical protein
MCKIWISNSAMTPWRAPLNFRVDRVVFFFRCDLLCLPSRVFPRVEAQIRLLRHLTQSRDGASNFNQKNVEFQQVPWPRDGLRWAFVQIVLCCFFLCDLLCLPRRVCPREEAQVRLLRHLTQTRDGALNFMLKLWNFYSHIFFPIELKIVVPPKVIQDQKNITEITVKGIKFGFQQVPWPRGGLRWTFVLIVLCFLSLWSVVPS